MGIFSAPAHSGTISSPRRGFGAIDREEGAGLILPVTQPRKPTGGGRCFRQTRERVRDRGRSPEACPAAENVLQGKRVDDAYSGVFARLSRWAPKFDPDWAGPIRPCWATTTTPGTEPRYATRSTSWIDLAEARLDAVEYVFQGGTPIAMNVGRGKCNPVPGLIAAIEKVLVRRVAVQCDQPRAGNATAPVADLRKVKLLFAWKLPKALVTSCPAPWRWHCDLSCLAVKVPVIYHSSSVDLMMGTSSCARVSDTIPAPGAAPRGLRRQRGRSRQ